MNSLLKKESLFKEVKLGYKVYRLESMLDGSGLYAEKYPPTRLYT